MSEFLEDVVIKEEYVIQESNVDFNNLLFNHDPKRKCGEIFLGNRGNFSFACALCHQSFRDLRSFGEHIRDVHLLPDDLAVSDDPIVNFISALLKPPSTDQFGVESELHNGEFRSVIRHFEQPFTPNVWISKSPKIEAEDLIVEKGSIDLPEKTCEEKCSHETANLSKEKPCDRILKIDEQESKGDKLKRRDLELPLAHNVSVSKLPGEDLVVAKGSIDLSEKRNCEEINKSENGSQETNLSPSSQRPSDSKSEKDSHENEGEKLESDRPDSKAEGSEDDKLEKHSTKTNIITLKPKKVDNQPKIGQVGVDFDRIDVCSSMQQFFTFNSPEFFDERVKSILPVTKRSFIPHREVNCDRSEKDQAKPNCKVGERLVEKNYELDANLPKQDKDDGKSEKDSHDSKPNPLKEDQDNRKSEQESPQSPKCSTIRAESDFEQHYDEGEKEKDLKRGKDTLTLAEKEDDRSVKVSYKSEINISKTDRRSKKCRHESESDRSESERQSSQTKGCDKLEKDSPDLHTKSTKQKKNLGIKPRDRCKNEKEQTDDVLAEKDPLELEETNICEEDDISEKTCHESKVVSTKRKKGNPLKRKRTEHKTMLLQYISSSNSPEFIEFCVFQEEKKKVALTIKDPLQLDEKNICDEGERSEKAPHKSIVKPLLRKKSERNSEKNLHESETACKEVGKPKVAHDSECEKSQSDQKSVKDLVSIVDRPRRQRSNTKSENDHKVSEASSKEWNDNPSKRKKRESNLRKVYHKLENDKSKVTSASCLKREKSDKAGKDLHELNDNRSRQKNNKKSGKDRHGSEAHESKRKKVERDSEEDSHESEASDSDDSSTENDVSETNHHESKRTSSKRMQIHRKTYCCYSCSKTFFLFDSYRNHYRTDHFHMIEKDTTLDASSKQSEFVTKIPEKMECKYCFKTFKEPIAFHNHMDNAHPDRMFICPQCPRTFRNWTARNHHVNAHKGEKAHACPHCPKFFTTGNILRAHIRKIHLNIKPHACRMCKRKFAAKAMLEIHERIHTKEKPFKCNECGKTFIAKKLLTTHLLRHKDIRNYKCMHCDKAFYDSRLLSAHMTTHTNETPYVCDVCDKKFKSRASLHNHKFLHTKKKQYACEKCGKKFRQNSGLYGHMKTHAVKA